MPLLASSDGSMAAARCSPLTARAGTASPVSQAAAASSELIGSRTARLRCAARRVTCRHPVPVANGYSCDAVKIFMPAGSKQPVIVHYTEHCPPDVGAAFIWLKNRDPERWRDVQNVEHVMGKYIISDRPMTEAEWAAERATVINDVVEELPAPEK
jgi:hypothetical protein